MAVHETHCIGPPGTGKSTWLQRQVQAALNIYQPTQILVMSFTRAAAANIAGRGTPLPRKNIATIHSFAYRLLGKPNIAESKVKDFNEEQPAEWQLTAQRVDEDMDFGAKEKRTQADELFEAAQGYRNRMTPRDEWPDDVREWFEDTWEKWKNDNSLADFTDLLEHALEDDSELEWEVQPLVCFVDEAQDCSALEMALVRKWSKRMNNLVLCGDPDQTIFTFKGADPNAMITTDAEHKRIVLAESFRVPRRVHTVARELILKIRNRVDAEYHPTKVEGELDTIPSASWADPGSVIEAALETVEQERTAMILASCAYQLEPTRKRLRKEAIPFHNPYRLKRADWNPLNIGGRGMTAAERMWRFTISDPATHGPEAKPWTWVDLKAWCSPLEAAAFRKGKRAALLRACDAMIENDKDPEAEPSEPPMIDDLEEWMESDDLDAASNADLDWFYMHIMSSQRKRFDYPKQVADKYGIKALRETPRIIIGTIHSVKGGESDDVWLFPDLSMAAHRESVRFGDDNNIRAFYVGVTRAKRKLTLTSPCEPYYMRVLESIVNENI